MSVEDQQTLHAEAFKEVFGAEVAPAFLELKDQMDAALYENCECHFLALPAVHLRGKLSASLDARRVAPRSNFSAVHAGH